ncbi:MAG: TonB-dependent receptor plug domain-containing protein, partial [Bacteroidales bacterium]|nr:TonB-dependent receptor plug domain-containing protein [Candidatus Colimorpha onthohippi]
MHRIFVITILLLLFSVGYAMPSVMASSPLDPPPLTIDTLDTPEIDSIDFFDEWDGEVEEDDAQKILDSIIVDSLLRDIDKMTDLDEVSIYGGDIPTISRSVSPTQTFSQERIRHLRAVQVSDLLRHTAGVNVFDCGGIGGTKGFSIRGLGSQFTNLSIDGIDVSNCANGVTDLGQYLVSGNSYIYFSTAGLSTHLHTARSLAAGNAINIETEVPIFTNGQTHNIKLGFEGGSQDMVAAYMQYEQQLTQKLTATAAATYLRSNGNYPFTQYYGPTTADTSASGDRRNSQLWQLSAEGNIFYNISRRQSFTLKTRFTRSHHNLPGRVAFYDKARPSATSEKSDYFAQFKYRARLGNWGNEDALQWQVVGKYQYHNDAYNDSSIRSLHEPMRNTYQHQEGYLSTALFYNPFKPIKLSISQDGLVGQLNSNLRQNNHALRLSSYTALSASFENSWLTLNANGVGTIIHEQVDDINQTAQNQIQNISPFVGFNIKPLSNVGLRLRGFYKESFQAPSFNELYYHAATCPFATEHALQRNIGLTFVTG